MTTRAKIHVREETRSVGEGEGSVTFVARSLVAAGAVVVSIDGAGVDTSEDDDRFELVAEAGVELSADRRALLSTVSGYPQVTRSKEGAKEKIVVSLQPLFAIDDDGWTARMSLYPPPSSESLPELTEIVAMLRQAGVRSGIRESNIAAALATVKAEERPHLDQAVARGRLPVSGENGRLRLEIITSAQSGEELGDGQMDYRERNLFTEVERGQLLATKIPATAGLAGVNVYGHAVPQQPGNDLALITGEDVVFDPASGEVRAAVAGVLSAVTDSQVKVSAKLTISGDVDYQTGNVRCRDAVEISGSIRPGFMVKAGGNTVIGGTVEGAVVECGGNVLVRGTITGEEALVQADGDVEAPVIAHGTVSAGGAVRISREAYYAKVRSLGDILLSAEAKVLGCELIAGGSITAASIDTEVSPNSLLAAAVVPERYARYYRLLKTFHQAQAKVDVWRRRFGAEADSDDYQELEEELDDARRAVTTYNLIPGAGERDRVSGLRHACRQRISFSGIVHFGAVIRIGNCEATLKKDYTAGSFALNGDSGKIEFHRGDNGSGLLGPEPI